MSSPAFPAAQRRCPCQSPWALMAALLALLLLLAALRPLALPDEGRYAEVGRWMAASGDWLIPRLNGLPFFHKPPLLYWLEAASVKLLGATPWAARLAPALHAALMLAALFLAARAFGAKAADAQAGGERLARRAALMLGSSPAFLLAGQYVNHDMLVAAWIGVAIWCFAAAFLHGDRPHAGWALAGFAACALGVLGKGLIGLALPGVTLLAWLLWTRQFGKVWRLPWLRGLLLFAAIAAPWFALAERRYPGMFAYLFGVQQFTRYVGGGFNNAQPWWFYLPVMVALLFPWSFFALIEGAAQARRWLRRGAGRAAVDPAWRPVLALCWIWMAAIGLFFSIPQSKLVGYILPVMPPLALLAAAGWQRTMAGRRAAGIWLALLAALALALACGANVAASRYIERSSARDIAQALVRAAAPGDPVVAVGGFPYDLPFHARLRRPLVVAQDWTWLRAHAGDTWERELFEAGDFDPLLAARLLQSPGQALQTARATPGAWVVVSEKHEAEVQASGFRLVARGRRWALYASPAKFN